MPGRNTKRCKTQLPAFLEKNSNEMDQGRTHPSVGTTSPLLAFTYQAHCCCNGGMHSTSLVLKLLSSHGKCRIPFNFHFYGGDIKEGTFGFAVWGVSFFLSQRCLPSSTCSPGQPTLKENSYLSNVWWEMKIFLKSIVKRKHDIRK